MINCHQTIEAKVVIGQSSTDPTIKHLLTRVAESIDNLQSNVLLFGANADKIPMSSLTPVLARINRDLTSRQIDCHMNIASGYAGIKDWGIMISSGKREYYGNRLKVVLDPRMPQLA